MRMDDKEAEEATRLPRQCDAHKVMHPVLRNAMQCTQRLLDSEPVFKHQLLITFRSLAHNQIHSLPDEVFSKYTKVKKM